MKIGILFDLDGTLLDTLQDIACSVNYALTELKLPNRSLEQVRSYVGNGAYRLLEQALPGREDDPAVEAAVALFNRHYNVTCNDTTCPYPYIPEALEILQKKYPIAIVSNKPDTAVQALRDRYFPGYFAMGVTPELPRKPAPDMPRAAMERLGVDTCIYVGDSEVDVLTAKNAGVPCLSVLWGFRDRADMEEVGG
ncbi:MAG: HAD-IA family hydrolase, partial [Oscillospiraceae bacterium]|nr:HAD-IA family hydrolase [Oscillospiraceae bacterium]